MWKIINWLGVVVFGACVLESLYYMLGATGQPQILIMSGVFITFINCLVDALERVKKD